MLGESLVGQNKFAEDELLKGYERLDAREIAIPPQARDRLTDLYAATGQPDEVKKWRTERTKYPPPVAPRPREKT